jgi:hypothetical protein
MKENTNRYIVETANGSILCTNGQVYKPCFVGPGGHNAKSWHTLNGARRNAKQFVGGKVVDRLSGHAVTMSVYIISGQNEYGKWQVKRPTLELAKQYAARQDASNLNVNIKEVKS